MKQTVFFASTLLGISLVASGCSQNYEPAPATQCGEIVKHSAKVLGKFANPKNEMLRQCQNSTDIQRGCALKAKNVSDLSRCQSIK